MKWALAHKTVQYKNVVDMDWNQMAEHKSVAIIGAGLVGPLQALFLAQAGFEVHMYDKRSDFRGTSGWHYISV